MANHPDPSGYLRANAAPTLPLPLPLPAELTLLPTAAGQVALYHAGPDPVERHVPGSQARSPGGANFPPLLLVHSVNAAGTAAEMAPLFAHYRQTRAVYALDLPGFGLSDRSDRPYTPRLMTDALLACLQTMAERHGAQAFDVVALSLGCEFAVRAQLEQPQRVGRLALVSPTGFNGQPRRYGPPQSTLGLAGLHRFLSHPWWSDALYRGLTRPGVIRYFLQRSWGAKKIDEALWHYDVLTTRQAGARFAPLYFLSAHLFSKDINTLYEALQCPVWVSMATRGDFTNYSGRSTVQGRANWHFHTVQVGALPYFEDLAAFVGLLDPFLDRPSRLAPT
jgi:pimeloyl-ACP methyl ester carboxylesterase